jgi:hypothetical protein
MPFEGGAVDWQGLAEALAEVGFGGPLNYEIPGENRCPMEERLEKLDRLAEITEDIFGRL